MEHPNFVASEWTKIKGRGRLAIVVLDRDTADFSHLVNQEVEIDGKSYRCIGVERFAHMPPWRQGESVGLLVQAK